MEPHRPRVDIDLQELFDLCKLHCTQADLAGWFHVTQQTIENRVKETDLLYEFNGKQMNFRAIMELGYSSGRVSLRRRQMKAAEEGNATMLVWLGKNVLGQRDNLDSRLTGADDGPIQAETGTAREILEARMSRLREREQSAEDPSRSE